MFTIRVYLFDWQLPRSSSPLPMHRFFWRQNVRQHEIDSARRDALLWCAEHTLLGNASGFWVTLGENVA
jgi:hypothetical protein